MPRRRHVDLAVVDEHGPGRRDAQVVQHMPEDLGVRLDQAKLAADVARREEVAQRAVPEITGEVRAGVGQQRESSCRRPCRSASTSMTAGLIDSHQRKSAAHSSCTRASSQLAPRSPAIACQYAAAPALPWSRPSRWREVGPPELLAPAPDPGQPAITSRSAVRRRQRDHLPVIEDHGPAGQRNGCTGHPGNATATSREP